MEVLKAEEKKKTVRKKPSKHPLFFKAYYEATVCFTRRSFRRYKNLKTIDDAIKRNISPKILHHLININSLKYFENFNNSVIKVIYVILAMVVIFLFPIVMADYFPIRTKILSNLLFVFYFAFIFIMFYFTDAVPNWLLRQNRNRTFGGIFVFSSVWILVTLISGNLLQNKNDLLTMAAILFSGLDLFIVNLYGAIFLISLSDSFLKKISYSYFPDAAVISNLIQLLSSLEIDRENWIQLQNRKKYLFLLEDTARCIETDLFKKLRSTDYQLDFWFQIMTKQVASALRNKKTWILSPKLDTYEHLRQSLSNQLVDFCTGNWDALEKMEPDKIPFHQTWLEYAKNVGKGIFVAGIPFVMFGAIQISPFALSDPVNDYAIGAALLWALFTLITTFDPLFTTKLESILSVVNVVSIIGKKQDKQS